MKYIRWIFLLIVVMCLVSLAGALIGQYVYNLWPCPWCVLIRIETVLIMLFCLIVFIFFSNKIIFWFGSTTALCLSFAGLASSAWMQWGNVKGTCELSLADHIITFTKIDRLWPDVFGVFGMCGDLTPFFGLSFPMWGVVSFIIMIVLIIYAMVQYAMVVKHHF